MINNLDWFLWVIERAGRGESEAAWEGESEKREDGAHKWKLRRVGEVQEQNQKDVIEIINKMGKQKEFDYFK